MLDATFFITVALPARESSTSPPWLPKAPDTEESQGLTLRNAFFLIQLRPASPTSTSLPRVFLFVVLDTVIVSETVREGTRAGGKGDPIR